MAKPMPKENVKYTIDLVKVYNFFKKLFKKKKRKLPKL